MYARNVTESDLKKIGEVFKFEVETENEGNRIRFRLKNNSGRFWAVSRPIFNDKERTFTSKVCFHGHYDFLDYLFREYPEAIVDASWYRTVRYTSENFRELAEQVGDTMVRQYDGLLVRDKCKCEEF